MRTNDDPQLEIETLAEPFRTKVVEAIHLLPRALREERLKEAFYSIVYLESPDVYIDLVTDSGTGAMSDEQWSGLMRGDEAYFRSRSFKTFETAVQEVMGFPHVVPTHQGRAAENIMMELLVKPGDIVLSNTHFDTTRAHVENRKATAVDLVGDLLWDFKAEHPFKGNFDLAKLAIALERYHDRVPFVLITVLNNFAASSPVSMENIRETRKLADRYKIPVYFDACRFAENAFFIKSREEGYSDKSIPEIVREMLSYGQGCWMSAKKDAIVNIGGFIAVRDEGLARRCQEKLVLYEGFPTYGGLARRDLEAIAIGLREGMGEAYLSHRIRQVAYLGQRFEEAGILVSKPVGGSGVFIDVASLYGHLPPERLPTIAFACDLYLEGGVRAAAAPLPVTTVDEATGEITTKIFPFARFAIPRRVYSKGHMDYVARVMERVKANAHRSKGYRLVHQPEVLGHFFVKFEPIS
jgi:tryptophanase